MVMQSFALSPISSEFLNYNLKLAVLSCKHRRSRLTAVGFFKAAPNSMVIIVIITIELLYMFTLQSSLDLA